MWCRYRFRTKSVEDYRPLVFNPKYPWWCSGYGDECAIIVAYLPTTEPLYAYWDDAYDIDMEVVSKIEFSSRFQKPDYFEE